MNAAPKHDLEERLLEYAARIKSNRSWMKPGN